MTIILIILIKILIVSKGIILWRRRLTSCRRLAISIRIRAYMRILIRFKHLMRMISIDLRNTRTLWKDMARRVLMLLLVLSYQRVTSLAESMRARKHYNCVFWMILIANKANIHDFFRYFLRCCCLCQLN